MTSRLISKNQNDQMSENVKMHIIKSILEHIENVRLSEFDPLKYGDGIVVRVSCTDDDTGDYEVQVYCNHDEKD